MVMYISQRCVGTATERRDVWKECSHPYISYGSCVEGVFGLLSMTLTYTCPIASTFAYCWHTRRHTSLHTSVHTQLVHQEAHRPPQSMCIYSLCNRVQKYTSLLAYACIHGWPTKRTHLPTCARMASTPGGTQTSSHACACIHNLCA